jgi:hypothetical protein
MTTLPTFHDAIVKSIRLDWAQGRCSVELDTAERPVQLVFSNVRLVLIPREQPWGPSVLLNALTMVGSGVFQMELQSGDAVQIKAVSLEVN